MADGSEEPYSCKLVATKDGHELIVFFRWRDTSFDLTVVDREQRAWSRQGCTKPPGMAMAEAAWMAAAREALGSHAPGVAYVFESKPRGEACLELRWSWRDAGLRSTRVATLLLDLLPEARPELWRMQRLLALSHSQLQGRVEAVAAENDRLHSQLERLNRELQGQERARQAKEQELFIKFAELLSRQKAAARDIARRLELAEQELADTQRVKEEEEEDTETSGDSSPEHSGAADGDEDGAFSRETASYGGSDSEQQQTGSGPDDGAGPANAHGGADEAGVDGINSGDGGAHGALAQRLQERRRAAASAGSGGAGGPIKEEPPYEAHDGSVFGPRGAATRGSGSPGREVGSGDGVDGGDGGGGGYTQAIAAYQYGGGPSPNGGGGADEMDVDGGGGGDSGAHVGASGGGGGVRAVGRPGSRGTLPIEAMDLEFRTHSGGQAGPSGGAAAAAAAASAQQQRYAVAGPLSGADGGGSPAAGAGAGQEENDSLGLAELAGGQPAGGGPLGAEAIKVRARRRGK
ncbi:hypothetical protein MNEG_3604 [Monoraphidium neglectum]|uniref:DNA repair protein XRCC4 n=1 Tax=Monoraphidium neglectum TaxID=145388 RepID=A0A0D2LC70_9CHLO|nr:hypothetical protein MNEG_3604 [Monoraphidium neglectum]KIZ04349.1 hypothetical protein MNEG_3604 [Monoraphidium neglectum]|eukprot:XP_013903368.1 hypothetical protein MNEG_3604 [Monoraphidium neglectum]